MAKSENQKSKILAIRDILYSKTDEEHWVTTQQLIDQLGKMDIQAERKSIYQDIATLEDYGMDIIHKTTRPQGYYLGSREFELAELKMLVDVVSASRFLTQKKSRELIKKLEGLASNYEASSLQRQVVRSNGAKSPNEHIYYSVDLLHRAMADNCQVTFHYWQWNMAKEMELKKNGALYQVSPWILLWDDENYYLVAYEKELNQMRHYRVDKMMDLSILDNTMRLGAEKMEHYDQALFSKKTFGMYAGREETVTMRMDHSLIGVMIDRFGTDVSLRAINEETFEARVSVQVSSQFYGWVTGLGSNVEIVKPQQVRQEYEQYLEGVLANYKNKNCD